MEMSTSLIADVWKEKKKKSFAISVLYAVERKYCSTVYKDWRKNKQTKKKNRQIVF